MRRLLVHAAALLVSGISAFVAPASPARAATVFTVNSTADSDDGACTRRTVGNLAAECTLREAINAANANGGRT